jgi:hypothetical protein
MCDHVKRIREFPKFLALIFFTATNDFTYFYLKFILHFCIKSSTTTKHSINLLAMSLSRSETFLIESYSFDVASLTGVSSPVLAVLSAS